MKPDVSPESMQSSRTLLPKLPALGPGRGWGALRPLRLVTGGLARPLEGAGPARGSLGFPLLLLVFLAQCLLFLLSFFLLFVFLLILETVPVSVRTSFLDVRGALGAPTRVLSAAAAAAAGA